MHFSSRYVVQSNCIVHLIIDVTGVLAVDAKTSDEGLQGLSDGVENLKWTCCGEHGGSVGCVRGEHIPTEPSKKRKREEA